MWCVDLLLLLYWFLYHARMQPARVVVVVGLKRKKKFLGFVCYFPLVAGHKNKRHNSQSHWSAAYTETGPVEMKTNNNISTCNRGVNFSFTCLIKYIHIHMSGPFILSLHSSRPIMGKNSGPRRCLDQGTGSCSPFPPPCTLYFYN